MSWDIRSGTSPLVSAETIFCISGANGTRLKSMLLPLAFSYAATVWRKDSSSSGTKPWVHHTLAEVAAALATNGRARVPAAARLREPRSTERLLSLLMSILPCPLPGAAIRSRSSHLRPAHALTSRGRCCRARSADAQPVPGGTISRDLRQVYVGHARLSPVDLRQHYCRSKSRLPQ